MSILNWFRRTKPEVKAESSVSAMIGVEQAQWSEQNAETYADEGYGQCWTVFRCIDLVASAVANMPLLVLRNDEEVSPADRLAMLLRRPNVVTSWHDLCYEFVAWRLMTGDTYLEAVGTSLTGGLPTELYVLRPNHTQVVARNGARIPSGYKYQDEHGNVRFYELDPTTGMCDVLHWHTMRAIDEWYGTSPLRAASRSADTINAAVEFNKRLLDNHGVPAGIIKSDKNLQKAQLDEYREQWRQMMAGPRNAGKVAVLPFGLDFVKVALSTSDLDWENVSKMSSQQIASCFGVPLQLIPVEGSQTFANYEQARLSFYEDTVLPLTQNMLDELSGWIGSRYGDGYRIVYDEDKIPALEPRRAEKWAKLQTADFLTINEKREAVGYEPLPTAGADTLLVGAGMLPIDLATQDPLDASGDADPDLIEDDGE